MRAVSVISVTLLFFLCLDSYCQTSKRKTRWFIGSFSTDSTDINGLSLGLWTDEQKYRATNTNGIKFELIGVGFAVPMASASSLAESDSSFIQLQQKELSGQVNGFNLSTSGSVCHCLTNGFQIGGIGQIGFQTNGVSLSLILNQMERNNGVMLAAFSNAAYEANGLQIGMWNSTEKGKIVQLALGNYSNKMKGIQIGIYNESSNISGIQIGLWNVNQRRKLPIFNWNF